MIWDSTDSELRCRLAAKLYNTPKIFKLVSEWLGCYQYILPENRKLHSMHRHFVLMGWQESNPSIVFNHWLFVDLLYCCFTPNEQVMVWKLINESLTSRILPY